MDQDFPQGHKTHTCELGQPYKVKTLRLGVWQPRLWQDLSQVTESQNIRERRDFNRKLQVFYL